MTWRVLDGVFAALFLLAAAAQYNDPDPVQWIAIYVAGTVLCVLSLLGRAAPVFALVLAAVALMWAATSVPVVLAHPPALAEVFGDARMMNPGVEEAREMLGLLTVGAWSLGVYFRVKSRRA